MDVSEISELKCMGMGEFNSDDHYSTTVGKNRFSRNRVAFIANKRVWNTVLGCNLRKKLTEWSRFVSKANHSPSVIKVYATTNNAKEAEVEQSCENLHDILEITLEKKKKKEEEKKDVLLLIEDWNAKVASQEVPVITGKIGLEKKMKQGKG